jgi:alpha-maltose-1-phosphate synthase
MRVAYLSTDPGIAYGGTKGASVHLGEMAAAMAREGAEVLLLVARIDPGAPEPPAGVTVQRLPGPARGASAAERVSAEPDRQVWLEERLGRFGAVALYERLALHSAAGSAAASRVGIPHLVELNAPLLQEAARYRTLAEPEVADLLERAVLRRADLVLAVSGPLARYARGRGARRVLVSPNGVDAGLFVPRPGRRAGPPSAVFTGTLRPWHGVDTLAAAWWLLGPNAPSLTVVGDGPGRAALEAAGAHVTGALRHHEVPGVLAGADIGIAPYAADAPPYFSPLKLFEYLAAGLAVVAAAIPGVTELVDERTAVLVPPGDPGALAGAVAALAADRRRLARLGRAGRELAEQNTWGHRAREVLREAGAAAGTAPRPAHVASPPGARA